jgi:anti-anti-sigma factor
MLVIGEECMDEPWSLVFRMEGAEDREKPVTFVCSGYMGRGERLAQLQEQANALAEQGRDMVLDLAHVTGMDSKALGAILTLKDTLKKKGHSCVLRNPSVWVMKVLEATRLAAFFEVERSGS